MHHSEMRKERNAVELITARALAEQRLKDIEREAEMLRTTIQTLTGLIHGVRTGRSPLRRGEPLRPEPALSLRAAIDQILPEFPNGFNRSQLVERLQKRFPNLDFSPRSLERPLRKLRKQGALVIIQPNIGNKIAARFGVKNP